MHNCKTIKLWAVVDGEGTTAPKLTTVEAEDYGNSWIITSPFISRSEKRNSHFRETPEEAIDYYIGRLEPVIKAGKEATVRKMQARSIKKSLRG